MPNRRENILDERNKAKSQVVSSQEESVEKGTEGRREAPGAVLAEGPSPVVSPAVVPSGPMMSPLDDIEGREVGDAGRQDGDATQEEPRKEVRTKASPSRGAGRRSSRRSVPEKSGQTSTVTVSMDLFTLLVFECARRRLEKGVFISKGDYLYEAVVSWLKKSDREVYEDYVGRGLIK